MPAFVFKVEGKRYGQVSTVDARTIGEAFDKVRARHPAATVSAITPEHASELINRKTARRDGVKRVRKREFDRRIERE